MSTPYVLLLAGWCFGFLCCLLPVMLGLRPHPRRGGYIKLSASIATKSGSAHTRTREHGRFAGILRQVTGSTAVCSSTLTPGDASEEWGWPLVPLVASSSPVRTSSTVRTVTGGAATSGRRQRDSAGSGDCTCQYGAARTPSWYISVKTCPLHAHLYKPEDAPAWAGVGRV